MMPQAAPAPPSDDTPGILREARHDEGLHHLSARIIGMAQPSCGVARIDLRMEDTAPASDWSRPNVAFRLLLGPAYGDVSRIYTVRDFDMASATLTFDVVRHGDESPMMRWLAQARHGDHLRLIGPRPHPVLPEAKGRQAVLLLDDSAMPALYSMFRQWPPGVTGFGWVATHDLQAFAQLPVPPGIDLRRIDAPGPHIPGHLLIRAITLADPASHVVWAAGERSEMRAIRQFFLSAVGLAKADLAIAAYWTRGVDNTSIDVKRREAYEVLRARGGTMAEIDDLAIEV